MIGSQEWAGSLCTHSVVAHLTLQMCCFCQFMQQSPRFLAPWTSFMEDNFFIDKEEWLCVSGCNEVAVGRTRLNNFTFTFYFHALEKEMATHSSVLAWRIPGTGEPGGLPSVGSHRVGHD